MSKQVKIATQPSNPVIFAHIIANIGLGFFLSNSFNLPALTILPFLFWLFLKLLPLKKSSFLLTMFFSQTLFMLSASLWFTKINALGWSNIGGLSPKIWMMLLLVLVVSLCSVILIPLNLTIYKLANKTVVNKTPDLIIIYFWSVWMTGVEIIRSLSFSLFLNSNNMPIEPSWSIYSVAQISTTNFISYSGRTLGFWGVSFLLFFLSGLVVALIFFRILTRRQKSHILASSLTILIVLIAGSFMIIGKNDESSIKLIGVNQQRSDPTYLLGLKDKIAPPLGQPAVVALPEYSNFLYPYRNLGMPTPTYDARDDYREKFKDSSIYFVGTEDEYSKGKRYVSTYIADGSLNKLSAKAKDFLIPGGEYIPKWIYKLLNKIDGRSAQAFLQSNDRHFINQEQYDINDSTVNKIGISACSSLLKPYYFRNQIKTGAQVFAVNVSYEQFEDAPQYEQLASQSASFISRALRRPMVLGSRAGTSQIYNESGELVAQSNGIAEKVLPIHSGKTLYGLVGDTFILSVIFSPVILIIIRDLLKHLKLTSIRRR